MNSAMRPDSQIEFLHHVGQPTMADLITGGERIHVADQLIGLADVAAHDAYMGFVHFAPLGELHDRDIKALKHRRWPIGPEPAPAMSRYVRYWLIRPHTLVKRRRDHGNVVQVKKTMVPSQGSLVMKTSP